MGYSPRRDILPPPVHNIFPGKNKPSIGQSGKKAIVIEKGKEKSSEVSAQDLLKLVMVSLQNQDPTNPMKGSELIGDLSILTNVRHTSDLSSDIKAMTECFRVLNLTTTAALVGKTVETRGEWFEVGGDHPFELFFEAPPRLTKATVFIYDEDGKEPIRTFPAASHPIVDADGNVTGVEEEVPKAGRHRIAFDGKNSEGEPIPPGKYRFVVSGVVKQGGKEVPRNLETSVCSTATAVALNSKAGSTIMMGKTSTPIDKVLSLTENIPSMPSSRRSFAPTGPIGVEEVLPEDSDDWIL
jgi:flagellar basal-body rod modification protein FlgD